jgi:hypothetical protein
MVRDNTKNNRGSFRRWGNIEVLVDFERNFGFHDPSQNQKVRKGKKEVSIWATKEKFENIVKTHPSAENLRFLSINNPIPNLFLACKNLVFHITAFL